MTLCWKWCVSNDWITPPSVFLPLHGRYHFKIDPCTYSNNPLGLPIFFTEKNDGLKQQWTENCFVNPPYTHLFDWVYRTALMAVHHKTVNVMLLPCGTDTRWFHEIIYDKERNEWRGGVTVQFMQGRIKFIRPNGTVGAQPRTPNMLVIFDYAL